MISQTMTLIEKIRKYIINILNDKTLFVFFTTLIYFVSVFLFNQTNKTLIGTSIVLLLIHWWRSKNFSLAVFLTYMTVSAFIIGKTYEIEMIPPGVIRSEYFPNGLLSQLVIDVSDIYIIIMLVSVISCTGKIGFPRFFKKPLIYLVIANFFGILSTFIISSRPDISLFYTIQSLLLPLLLLFIMIRIRDVPNIKAIIITFIIAFVLFESTVALGQFIKNGFLGSSLENTGYVWAGTSTDEDVFRFRPLGTTSHPNALSQTLICLIPVLFSLLYGTKKLLPKATIVALAASLITVVLIRGRSAWFSLFMSVLFMLYVLEKKWKLRLSLTPKTKKLVAVCVILTVIGILMVFPQRLSQTLLSWQDEASGSTRWLLMKEWGQLIILNPVLGVGPGMSVVEAFYQNTSGVLTYFPEAVHNFYLLMASETGLISLFFFILFILINIKMLLTDITHLPIKDRLLPIGVITGLGTLLINWFFQPYANGMTILLILSTILLAKRVGTRLDL